MICESPDRRTSYSAAPGLPRRAIRDEGWTWTQHLKLAVHTFPCERPVLITRGFTRSAEPFDPNVDIPQTPTLIVAGAEDDRLTTSRRRVSLVLPDVVPWIACAPGARRPASCALTGRPGAATFS
jgi:hypothetical protein